MAIYNIKNKGSGKYLNITGDYLTSLTNNQNVMLMYGREAQDMDSQPCHYSEVRGTQ